MTYWKCPNCAGERETEDNIIIATCSCCQVGMNKTFYPYKKEVEVEFNGYRSPSKAD